MYLAAMVYVGFYLSKKGGDDSVDEFYLGGRKLDALVTVMNVEASDMSSWLLMGLPGAAYLTDIADTGWTTIGLAVGTYLSRLIVAERLHRYPVACGTITIPGFFSRRCRGDRNILMCITAIVILIFFIPYIASGLRAVGTLFDSLFDVNYHVAMIAGVVVIIGYAVLGGLMTAPATDLAQSIVMSIALIIVVFSGIHVASGWNTVADNVRSLAGYLSTTYVRDMVDNAAFPYGIITILSTIAWELGYFGMPHILLCFMAISHEDKLKTSRRIASIWVVISMLVAILIGIIGSGASVAGGIPMFSPSSESGTVIIRLADLLGRHGILLSVVAGVVLAGILVRIMFTADSQLLTAALDVSQNLLQDSLKVKVDTKASTTAVRITVAGITLVATSLTWNPDSPIFATISLTWVGSDVSFRLVVLFVLFWKRSNLKGALADMVSGGVMVFVWKYGVCLLGDAWSIYELLPASIVACTTIVVVSLMTKTPPVEIYDEYGSVRR